MTGIVFAILPDMGQYATYVWSTYAIALAGLVLLALSSWHKNRKLGAAVKKAEGRKKK